MPVRNGKTRRHEKKRPLLRARRKRAGRITITEVLPTVPAEETRTLVRDYSKRATTRWGKLEVESAGPHFIGVVSQRRGTADRRFLCLIPYRDENDRYNALAEARMIVLGLQTAGLGE